MEKNITISLFITFLVISVAILFVIHWFNIRKLESSTERLVHSRGSYLGFSLIILMACWILCYLSGFKRAATQLSMGYISSFIGDIFNLQFDRIKRRVEEPIFLGILFFMVSQILYISAFINLVGLALLIKSPLFYTLLVLFLICPTVIFKLKVFSPDRPKRVMRGALIYGFLLGGMTAVVLTSAILAGGYWWLVLLGSLMFLLSDAVMGGSTIRGLHPKYEFQVPWLTYLIAQGLILFVYRLI